jgi:hypothetical protein
VSEPVQEVKEEVKQVSEAISKDSTLKISEKEEEAKTTAPIVV